jgi:hypothetical protein
MSDNHRPVVARLIGASKRYGCGIMPRVGLFVLPANRKKGRDTMRLGKGFVGLLITVICGWPAALDGQDSLTFSRRAISLPLRIWNPDGARYSCRHHRLCYIRGPEGLLIGLAEELRAKR